LTARTVILEWSLRLEKDGVLGEGMSFSDKEKESAASATYHIQNYISHVTNSQIQQNTKDSAMKVSLGSFDMEAVKEILRALDTVMSELRLQGEQLSELRASIDTIRLQIASSHPKETIIREALRSIRNILEGAAGSAIISGVLPQISRLLG
jgi:hypothetical protein